MAVLRENEDGTREIVRAKSPEQALLDAGLPRSMLGDLDCMANVANLIVDPRIANAPKQQQAVVFMRAMGYTARETAEACQLCENTVNKYVQDLNPGDTFKFDKNTMRRIQQRRLQRLQNKILDRVSEKDFAEADLKAKVDAISTLQRHSDELADKIDAGQAPDGVAMMDAVLKALPVKATEVKQLPEKT